MNTQVIPEQGAVAEYIRRVREALADLPVEDVDDLVQGMEADLTEVASEGSGSLVERLGSPEAYAAELRSAAGLPEPQAANAVDGFWAAERTRLRGHREALVSAFPGLPVTLTRLAPLWWAARGAALGWLLFRVFFGSDLDPWPMLLGAGISIWWALRARPLGRAGRVVSAFATALAIVALMPMTVSVLDRSGRYSEGPYNGFQESYPSGLSQDGQGITQLYAYDRDGKRLDDVRIYDQTGRPVTASQDGTADQWVDASGRTWSNVFPGRSDEGQGWTVLPGSGAWHPPMAIAPLVTRTPVTVDVLPNDGPADGGAGDPAAPTEASPTASPTVTVTTPGPGATTPVPSPTSTATAPATPRPTATTTRPAGTVTTR